MSGHSHHLFFKEALTEAWKARGLSRPNPAVGAVIVHQGNIIGRGHTSAVGGPHAEVNAIENVTNKSLLKDSEIFVTLEPCAHEGRTPPCTDAIIKSGIRTVHAALRDPNPLFAGLPEKILLKHGVQLVFDFPEADQRRAFELMLDFFWKQTQKKPFVSVKAALSLDGRMAADSGHSQWISGEQSRQITTNLRRGHDAILVGSETARLDNPRLTIRTEPVPSLQPLRIAIDRDGVIPPGHHLFTEEHPTVFVMRGDLPRERRILIEKAGKEWMALPLKNGRFDPASLCQNLAERFELNSILIEGGPSILGSFLKSGALDSFHLFFAPLLLGGQGKYLAFQENHSTEKISEALSVKDGVWEKSGEDLYYSAKTDAKSVLALYESVARSGFSGKA